MLPRNTQNHTILSVQSYQLKYFKVWCLYEQYFFTLEFLKSKSTLHTIFCKESLIKEKEPEMEGIEKDFRIKWINTARLG